MYVQERRTKIVLMLKEKKRVSVKELSKELKVSEASIRRDIKALHAQGLLVRTHGGAIHKDRIAIPQEFAIRETHNPEIKTKVAKAVLPLIKPFDTIMIDDGTTTYQIVVELLNRADLENITMITCSIPIAYELTKTRKVKGILTGGNVDPHEHSTAGPLALNNIDNFRATKTILGITGIDLEHGLTDDSENMCELKKKMLRFGLEKIIVTDSSKFGKVASYSLCPLKDIDMIVTDSLIDEETKQAIMRQGINLITV